MATNGLKTHIVKMGPTVRVPQTISTGYGVITRCSNVYPSKPRRRCGISVITGLTVVGTNGGLKLERYIPKLTTLRCPFEWTERICVSQRLRAFQARHSQFPRRRALSKHDRDNGVMLLVRTSYSLALSRQEPLCRNRFTHGS